MSESFRRNTTSSTDSIIYFDLLKICGQLFELAVELGLVLSISWPSLFRLSLFLMFSVLYTYFLFLLDEPGSVLKQK